MSELVIKSGDSGNTAQVDSKNRLVTFSVTEGIAVSSSINGETFQVRTGIVNLTSSTISHIFFIKNEDTVDWVIERLLTSFGLSTGASGVDFFTTITVNPTGGTLITGGG